MFEAYVEMGAENVGASEVAKGFASFAVVAIGGTIIGIIWGYVTGFVTRFTNHARILEPLFVFVMVGCYLRRGTSTQIYKSILSFLSSSQKAQRSI